MLVETGFCRAKNAAHVAMTNFVIFAVGGLAYWAVGFALQFGGVGGLAALGGVDRRCSTASLKLGALGPARAQGLLPRRQHVRRGRLRVLPVPARVHGHRRDDRHRRAWPSAGSSPRSCRSACSWRIVVYPVYGMWVWGGGWLAQLGVNAGLGHGVLDFAGSSVVHAVGGFSALAGALVIGPRIGKFKADGTPGRHPRPPHPDGDPRHDHPGVRLDGLQRHEHAGRRRPALHGHHRQHDPRRCRRLPRRDVRWCGSCGASPTRRCRPTACSPASWRSRAAARSSTRSARSSSAPSPACSSSARSSSGSASSRSTTRSARSRCTA